MKVLDKKATIEIDILKIRTSAKCGAVRRQKNIRKIGRVAFLATVLAEAVHVADGLRTWRADVRLDSRGRLSLRDS